MLYTNEVEEDVVDVLNEDCGNKSSREMNKLTKCKCNNGQSNLATGGIAANWGFRPPNLPFPPGPLSNKLLLGTA